MCLAWAAAVVRRRNRGVARVTIAVVGATPANTAAITAVARDIEVRADDVPDRTSWIVVATVAQRRDVMERSRLPAFRVIHVPGLDRDGALDVSVLAEGVKRMRELGPYTVVPSPAAVAVTRWLMPWIRPRLERWLGASATTIETKLSKKAIVSAEKVALKAMQAERRAAMVREGLGKSKDSARERERAAQRKAQRKAERRAKEALVSDTPTQRQGR